MNYLGQLVPATNIYVDQENELITLQNIVLTNRSSPVIVNLYVTSKNALKVDAAVSGTKQWLTKVFSYDPNFKINVVGYEVSSGISEQPCGEENTMRGAINRMQNMKQEMQNGSITCETAKDSMSILISLENGICLENVSNLKNSDIFEVEPGKAWVDRCVCISEVWARGHKYKFMGVSEGVTTPRETVKLSEQSNWNKTAGSFIAEIYKFNAKDWHGSMAGKGRLQIMTELIQNIFKASSNSNAIPIPIKTSTFKPDVYHQYNSKQIDFFVPRDIIHLLKNEQKKRI